MNNIIRITFKFFVILQPKFQLILRGYFNKLVKLPGCFWIHIDVTFYILNYTFFNYNYSYLVMYFYGLFIALKLCRSVFLYTIQILCVQARQECSYCKIITMFYVQLWNSFS